MKKIFISYSHKDEKLKDQVIDNLKAIKLSIDPWVDKSEIDAGDEWEIEIQSAIDKSEMAILLISTDFLNSKFITEKELPWIARKNSLFNYRIIPFILKPSSWDEFEFYRKLEKRPKEKSLIEYLEDNGDRDNILVDFAKEVKKLIAKVEEPKIIEDNELFYKTFAIFRVLELYSKYEEYTFKLTSNLSIYKKGQEYPIEIWKFVEEIESIEEYANMAYNLFDKDHMDTYIGIVQKDRLSSVFRELSSFFDTLKLVEKYDEKVKLEICSDFNNQHDLGTFTGSFFKNNISLTNTLFDINSPMAIFYFTNFSISGYTDNELRKRVFDIIPKKFKIKLTDDGTDIFALKPFSIVFKKALEYIDINKGNFIEFNKLLSLVEILDLPFKNVNNLDFIKDNLRLVEQNISDFIDINIDKLYVKSKAKFYYKDQDFTYKNVENLSNWLDDQINTKDFLILLGDFGHGKTTFFKHMTANLSKKYLELEEKEKAFTPVYVSLRQHFVKGGNLKDAVTNAVMPRSKMTDEFWESNRWLIFCDGFDELSIYHQDEPNWITLVFSMLYTQSQKENIKIVLSSRPVLFLDPSIRKETLNQFNRLILKPFDESQITKWLENWSKYNKPVTIDDIKERNLLEVSQTPVILFLIATIFYEELNDENIKYTKSQIYKKFFDWTAKSGGYIQKGENVKHNVPNNYREILQEIACEIFSHPDATSGMLHYEVLLKQLSQKFEDIDFKKSLNEKIFVAHAFKESVPEHIEFMHQSLREYLVAEKIFNVFYDLLNKEMSYEDVEYNKIIFYKPLTIAKLNFFKDMINNIEQNEKEKLRDNSCTTFDWSKILFDIIENENIDLENYSYFTYKYKEIMREGGFDEISPENDVLIANFTLVGYLFHFYLENSLKDSFNSKSLNQLLHFFKSNNRLLPFVELLNKSFQGLTFKDSEFKDIDFRNFELIYNTYCNVSFKNCNFKNTDFSNSIFLSNEYNKPPQIVFKDSSFEDIKLDKCKFQYTVFKNCTFKDVVFSSSIFNHLMFYGEQTFFDAGKERVYMNLHFEDNIFYNCKFIHELDAEYNIEEISEAITFKNCIMQIDNIKKWSEIDGNNIWNAKI